MWTSVQHAVSSVNEMHAAFVLLCDLIAGVLHLCASSGGCHTCLSLFLGLEVFYNPSNIALMWGFRI
jgi:hypothetical protein